MKKNVLLLALTVTLLILQCHSSFAARYYFSSSGDDSRTAGQAQNPDTPWKSIDKLNAIFHTLKPGDEVFFKRGDVFYGSIRMNSSGRKGAPIVLSAYGSGPKPVITSLVTLKDWKSVGGGIYEASHHLLKNDVSIVLFNDNVQELGRYPNNNSSDGGYAYISSSIGSSSITSNDLPSLNFTGGEVVIRKNQWIIDRHRIVSNSGNRINFMGFSSYHPSKNYGFFIQNHIKTLDQEGEWYYNQSARKLNMFFNSNPSSNVVEVSTLDHLLTKSYGASHLRIDNLHFKGANKDVIHISGGRDIRIENTDVEFSGENGITSMSILDLIIDKNRVNHSFNNGIYLRYGNDGAKVSNNVVENTFVFPGSSQSGDGNGIGIYAISDNSVIEYNKVINTGYTGIYFGGNSTLVKNNLIDFYCTLKNDGGGIYTYVGRGNQRFRDRKVIGNIILNGVGSRNGIPDAAITSKGQAQGIFLDDNTNGVELIGNTISDANHNGIKISNSREIDIRENLIYNSHSQIQIGNGGNGDDSRQIKVINNILFSKYSDQYSYILKTNKNDIHALGEFNSNYLYRPLGDAYSILVGYVDNRKQVEKTVDLKGWQKQFGEDKNSSTHPKQLESFKVKKLIGNSMFENSSLDRSISGLVCNSCTSSWVTGKLNGGSAKVETQENSSLTTVVGEVKKDKNYILKFKAASNKEGSLRIFLRHSGSPWEVVSPATTVEVSQDTKEYTILLKPYADIDRSALIILSEEGNWTYWIDDVELKEAEVEIYRPQDKFLFEYNATKSKKSIALDGTYVDVKNREVSGTITLEPFTSIVLIRTSEGTPKPLPPSVKISSPTNNAEIEEGKDVQLQADVTVPSGTVRQVEFFSGKSRLGQSTESPYSFDWKNPAIGRHTIVAKVTDSNGRTATSDPIVVEVSKKKLPSDEASDDQDEPVNSADAMSFNIGNSSSLKYNGQMYAPIADVNLENSKYSQGRNPSASSEPLFQSSNFGSTLSYSIQVPNGNYTIKTYHIEEYFGYNGIAASAGQRVFDILLENQTVKKDFDMYKENNNRETVLTFSNIEVKDGKLDLVLQASQNNAIISGLSIIKNESAAEEPDVSVGKPVDLENALLINVGSTSDVKHEEGQFTSDYSTRYFIGHSNIVESGDVTVDPLFRSHRFAKELKYAIPVPNGTYTVKTYHHETYFGRDVDMTGPGKRVFDIMLEGRTVKKGVDIFRESKNTPLTLTFENVQVVDGELDLEMPATVNNALLSGLAIISHSDNISFGSANLRVQFEESDVDEDENKVSSAENTSTPFTLYPNPARDQVSLRVNKEVGVFDILIHDMSGQLLDHYDSAELFSGSGEYIISIPHLRQGVYMVTIAGEREILTRLRLIVSP